MATKEFELLAAFGEPTFFRTAFNYELKDVSLRYPDDESRMIEPRYLFRL